MYNPQTSAERKLIESIIAERVYNKPFHVMGDAYAAAITRTSEASWDEQGRLEAYLDINPIEGYNMLTGDIYPIYFYVEIDFKRIESVSISWEMPENPWGYAQSNTWPIKPVLSKPE